MKLAHQIHSSKTNRAKAVCALKGEARWAVSGTPIQNRWGDIVSLLIFLGVYKEQDIRDLRAVLKQDSANTYVRRMLSLICLRRSKKVIKLPKRTDKIHKLRFNSDEAIHYKKFNDNITNALDDLQMLSTSSYNILAKINSLRQICNLGTNYEGQTSTDAIGLKSQDLKKQEMFDCALSTGMAACSRCETNLPTESDGSEDPLGNMARQSLRPQISSCGVILCTSCSALPWMPPWPSHQGCAHAPYCEFQPVVYSNATGIKSLSHNGSPLPIKMRALLDDLAALPHEDKRYC